MEENPNKTAKEKDMIKAFKMKLFAGMEEEYRRRHNELWEEMKEMIHAYGGSDYSIFLDRETLTLCAQTFCDTIEQAGHRSMIYFNSHVSRDLLDLQALQDYPFWFAQYRDALDYEYQVDVWQYTETGTVPGIKGKVDIDLMFLYG